MRVWSSWTQWHRPEPQYVEMNPEFEAALHYILNFEVSQDYMRMFKTHTHIHTGNL